MRHEEAPVMTVMKTIVKEWVAPDGMAKVQVFRRADGSFGFESLVFCDEPRERSWIPEGRYSACFASSPERAEREARERVSSICDRSEPA